MKWRGDLLSGTRARAVVRSVTQQMLLPSSDVCVLLWSPSSASCCAGGWVLAVLVSAAGCCAIALRGMLSRPACSAAAASTRALCTGGEASWPRGVRVVLAWALRSRCAHAACARCAGGRLAVLAFAATLRDSLDGSLRVSGGERAACPCVCAALRVTAAGAWDCARRRRRGRCADCSPRLLWALVSWQARRFLAAPLRSHGRARPARPAAARSPAAAPGASPGGLG
jgi:hypothetical protein